MKSFAVCGASLVLVLSLCSAAHAQPLTVKGSITVGGGTVSGTASLHLISTDFDLSFSLDDVLGPSQNGCNKCDPNTPVGLGFTISGPGQGSGTIQGTSYSQVYLGGALSARAVALLPQPQPGDVATISAPFVFTGSISAYHTLGELQNGPAFYNSQFIGRGIVTANLQRDTSYPNYHWHVTTSDYEFYDPDLLVPYPWLSADVGAVGQPGSASYANGAFTIGGSGADIWGTDDAFRFVSQFVPGQSEDIVARVTAQDNTDPFAKAGVMLRQSYDSNAAGLILDLTPQGHVEFMTRQSPSASTTFIADAPASLPVWLKLSLVEGTATAAISNDGSTWNTVGSIPWSSTASLIGLAVTSHNNSTVSHAMFENVTIRNLTVSGFETDIGDVGQPGWATFSDGVYTIAGAGADIWGTADAFHYVYTEGSGGGSDPRQTGVLARVTSVENTHPYAKAGLEIRAGLTASAAHVILDVTPNGGIEFMTRASAGAQTTVVGSAAHAVPVWLKLVENDTVITGAFSDDGYQWTTVGTTTFAPASDSFFEPLIGMAVTSHDTSVLNVSTFDHVRFSTLGSDFAPTVTLTSPSDGAAFTSPATIQIAADALDQDGPIAKVEFTALSPAGTAFDLTDTTSPYSATWSNVAAGTYRIFANVTDNDGAQALSNTVTITVTNGSGGGGSTPFSGTPAAIPGTVEAENFDNGGEAVAYHDSDTGNNGGQYRTTDVDIEATSDAGGGDDVGWIAAGEWLNYTVNVASAGSYSVDVRVASLGQGGTFHIEAGGADVSGPLTIPDTGDWQNWTTISHTILLSAGTQILRVIMDSAGAISVGNINWLRFSTSTSGGGGGAPTDIVVYANDLPSTARHGSWTIAGDPSSPNGVALATSDTGFASTDAPLASPADYVDIRFSANANTPYTIWLRMKALNDVKSNDSVWVQFSDALAGGSAVYPIGTTAGLLVNLATDGTGASLHNWGWQNTAYWLSQATTVTFASSGDHTMRIQVREDGVEFDQIVLSPSAYAMNPPGPVTDDSTIVAKASAGLPFGGTAPATPATIEAENFDAGGDGVGYHDLTTGNDGGVYRTTDDVDLIAATGNATGYVVNEFQTGEWLDYTLTVAKTGFHTIQLAVSSGYSDSVCHVEVDGVDVSGSVTVPNTGAWSAFQLITMRDLQLSGGTHVIRVYADNQYFNLDAIHVS